MSGPAKGRETGFSLVEVLVAVTIVSLLAGAVVLSLRPPPPAARAEADRLAARFVIAAEEALLNGAPIGFSADDDLRGYAFLSWRDGDWRPMTGHPALQPRRLPEAVFLEVRAEDDIGRRRETRGRGAERAAVPGPALPQALFDPAGLDAPFSAEITGPERNLTIRRDAGGAIAVSELARRREPG